MSDQEIARRAEALMAMSEMEVGVLAGAVVGEPMNRATAKIARYCALVAIGALPFPDASAPSSPKDREG